MVSPSPEPLPRVGTYEVLAPLATGGMAEIYLARSVGIQGFEKLVVVKQMIPELTRRRELVTMFLDEARIAATLLHPNIVQVYDVGEVEGRYFFSMEFLHGVDISKILRRMSAQRKHLALDHVVQVLLGVCAGLHYAHEKIGFDGRPVHIVHRDVSPQNIMATFDGGVKLLDFGIAKAADRATATRQGTLKGKLQYMSPEQCSSEPLDRRSDIFSLCIVGWELVTGRPLVPGAGDLETLKRITERDAPPPSSVRKDCPRQLDRILLTGLRRPRGERQQTALELQGELEAFARQHDLDLSTSSLVRFVRELFADLLAAWEQAQRQGSIAALAAQWAAESASAQHPSMPPADEVLTSTLPSRRSAVAGAAARRGLTRRREADAAPPKDSRSWRWLGAGVAAVVLAAVVGLLLPAARRRLRAPAAPTPAHGPAAPAPPPSGSTPAVAPPAPAPESAPPGAGIEAAGPKPAQPAPRRRHSTPSHGKIRGKAKARSTRPSATPGPGERASPEELDQPLIPR